MRNVTIHNHLPAAPTRTADALPDGVARDVSRWRAKIQEHRQQLVQYKDDPSEVRAIKRDIADLERMISDAQKMYGDAAEWSRFQLTYRDKAGSRHTVEVHAENAAKVKTMFAQTAEPGESVVSVVADQEGEGFVVVKGDRAISREFATQAQAVAEAKNTPGAWVESRGGRYDGEVAWQPR